jgi:hypothetical protein
MKLSDKISAPLGYARTAIAETISAVWTFNRNPEIRALGVDAGGTSGANHTFHSVKDNAGTPTDTYTRIGQAGGSVSIPIIQIRDTATEDRVAQWNFNLDSTITNVEDAGIKHNFASFGINSTGGGSVLGSMPEGWVLSERGVGHWRITHSLSKTLYPSVSVWRSDLDAWSAQVAATTNTYFEMVTHNAGTAADIYVTVQVAF